MPAYIRRARRAVTWDLGIEGGLPMRGASKVVLILMAAILLPSAGFSQGTLTGTVRDQSGGVLPGVTVDASSPALIEKVRTAVTDDTGQYRITGLNPGTYSLTFRHVLADVQADGLHHHQTRRDRAQR